MTELNEKTVVTQEKKQAESSHVEAVVMRPVANWEELAAVEGNEKYELKITIEEGFGWINPKNNGGSGEYLSTHTFYGKTHEYSTKMLQRRGFNVVLANWDA